MEGAAGSECERKVRASRAVCECVCLCDHLLRPPSVGGIRARSRHSAAAGGGGGRLRRVPGSQAEGLRRLQAYIRGMQDVDFWLFQELIGSPRGETMRCLVALLLLRNSGSPSASAVEAVDAAASYQT